MNSFLDNLRSRNAFIPAWQGMFLNPAWLIRKTLARAIRREAAFCKGTVLDFGCGARPYESLFNVDRYIGLDIESSGHPPEGKCPDIYYDGKHIPLDDESINHVFSAEVFEHVFNVPELFIEIHRVLRPGGTLIMTCPFVWPLHEEPYDFARYTPYALKSLLSDAGFENVSVKPCGHAIEAICQLALEYTCGQLIPAIPIIGGAIRTLCCTFFNISARILSRLLPSNGKLYLSNVVVAHRKD